MGLNAKGVEMEKQQAVLNNLLTQLEEIFETLKQVKSAPAGKPTPSLSANLDMLERGIKLLAVYQAKALRENRSNVNNPLEEIMTSPVTDPNTKEWLQRSKQIENHVQVFREALQRGLKRHKMRQKEKSTGSSATNTKQQIQERRKLFKTLGGDQKWMPL